MYSATQVNMQVKDLPTSFLRKMTRFMDSLSQLKITVLNKGSFSWADKSHAELGTSSQEQSKQFNLD